MVSLSVVIPAYNEQEAIGPALDRLDNLLADVGFTYEIIVVDDGSTDETAAIVEKSSCKLIRHLGNLGYGSALKTGIRAASYEIIVITDADGTYPSDAIPNLVTTLMNTKCDMIVGSRTGADVAIPLIRKPAKWVISKLANIASGRNIPDINSGLRVFRSSIAMRFFPVLPDGFSFTTTITLGMLCNGYTVQYVPINYHSRIGRSKIRPIKDTLNFLYLILNITLYFAPLKIFIPISAALILVSVMWGVFSAFVLGKLADISTLVIFMSAVQVGAVGLLAELINGRTPNYYKIKQEAFEASRSKSEQG